MALIVCMTVDVPLPVELGRYCCAHRKPKHVAALSTESLLDRLQVG